MIRKTLQGNDPQEADHIPLVWPAASSGCAAIGDRERGDNPLRVPFPLNSGEAAPPAESGNLKVTRFLRVTFLQGFANQ